MINQIYDSSLDPISLSAARHVAETGSVTEAARRLHLTQPAVSYRIRKLEESLGGAIFRRETSGMIPTPAGERLLAGATRILEETRRTILEIQRIIAEDSSILRLTSACFTSYHWLPAVLERLEGVSVELDVDPSRRPFERVDRGELDIALTTDPPRRGPFRSDNLFADEIVAVIPPDHALATREWLVAEDFRDERVAVFDRSNSDLFSQILFPAGVQPAHVFDIPVTGTLLELVRSGHAITAMASWVPAPDLAAGRLVAVRISPGGLQRTWYAVRSSRRAVSDAAERFVKVLAELPTPPNAGD